MARVIEATGATVNPPVTRSRKARVDGELRIEKGAAGEEGCERAAHVMEVVMTRRRGLVAVVAALGLGIGVAQSTFAQAPAGLDTAAIEQATGLKGQLIANENVFKVGKPRADVKVNIDGWTMSPFMGLGSWAAFTPAHGSSHVMMMGDTVLFEDEVNPAMSAAFDGGLEVTALHNHFFFDEPKVYFMHIGGTATPQASRPG
jgi:hypothetical protein